MFRLFVFVIMLALPAVAVPLPLVGPDTNAVVVVPDGAQPVTVYAAEELTRHVEQATGVKLPTWNESNVPGDATARVYLGPTRAADEADIQVDALASEAFVLRSADDHYIIAAASGPGDPIGHGMTMAGVLWGVYEVLEREVGVRWLWPGELGTHVPRTETVALSDADETVPPRYVQRQLRPGLGPQGFATADERLSFTPEQRARYGREQTVFLRRHRMGRSADTYFSSRRFGSGHSFHHWWERYGEEHPEWFQLRADGERGPENPAKPHNVAMCVSNPELHRKVVALWAEERAKHPGEPLGLGVGENDTSAACLCEHCLAWDGPAPDLDVLPEGLERSFLPVQASTRYAKFAQAVHALAREIDPDVRVHFYAYLNYFWAPEPGLTLDPNITIGFVPWFRWAGWYPRTDAEHTWIKEQWTGWQRTGATLYYRPNWFLDGYAMPHVYMHQFADAFQFYAANGMYATDFDSLQGMWAAQGPNLYLLARIHVRPGAPVDDLLDEYYAAFGPAKDTVRAYFEHWEGYSMQNRAAAANVIQRYKAGHFRRYAHYARAAEELYPPEVFDEGFAFLDEAAEQAQTSVDAVYARRVAFLREGLTHALRCVETAEVMNERDATPAARAEALARLSAYRRSIEHLGIANLDRAAIIETDSWQDVPGFR